MRIEDFFREWLLDCFSDPFSQDEIEECSHAELASAVERYWDGGLVDFCGLMCQFIERTEA